MNKGKQSRDRFPIEYRLLITPKFDEREKTPLTKIALRTIKEFTNFRYEIILVPELSGRTLTLRIQGLRAPRLTLPGSGPAICQLEYAGLSGTYTVVIWKLKREENTFSISISGQKVAVLQSPRKTFVEVVTHESEF
jgi:hypothetical protein